MNHTACSMSEDPMSAPILTSTFAYLYLHNTALRLGSQAEVLTAVNLHQSFPFLILSSYAFISQRTLRRPPVVVMYVF